MYISSMQTCLCAIHQLTSAAVVGAPQERSHLECHHDARRTSPPERPHHERRRSSIPLTDVAFASYWHPEVWPGDGLQG